MFVASHRSRIAALINLKPNPALPAPSLALQRPQDAAPADHLIDRAFGPGRLTKSSERVREFAEFAPDLSFCAWRGQRLVGVVRNWRVRVGDTKAVFLGPIAVEADERSSGVGGLLVAAAVEAARAAGENAVVLVGDEPFFGRFGFSAALAREVRMPGPVDQNRLLAIAFTPQGERLAGFIQPL